MEDHTGKIAAAATTYVEALWAETPYAKKAKYTKDCHNVKSSTDPFTGVTCFAAKIPYDKVCDACKARRAAAAQYKVLYKRAQQALRALKYQVKRRNERIPKEEHE